MLSLKCLFATVLLAIAFPLCVNASPGHVLFIFNACGSDTKAYIKDSKGQVIEGAYSTAPGSYNGIEILVVTVNEDFNSYDAYLEDSTKGIVNDPQFEISMEPSNTVAIKTAKLVNNVNPTPPIVVTPISLAFDDTVGCPPLTCVYNGDIQVWECTPAAFTTCQYSEHINLAMSFCVTLNDIPYSDWV